MPIGGIIFLSLKPFIFDLWVLLWKTEIPLRLSKFFWMSWEITYSSSLVVSLVVGFVLAPPHIIFSVYVVMPFYCASLLPLIIPNFFMLATL